MMNQKTVALELNEIFGNGNFFLEIQNHFLDEQKIIIENNIRLSNETGIPIVCTNDSHYIYEDEKPHDILCIQTGKNLQTQTG